MAQVQKAELSTIGSGAQLMLVLDVEIDWDRGDDEAQWELQIRFLGADAGRDDVLLVHAVPASPADGDRRRVEISGASGAFDEDRGDDEVLAEVSLVMRSTDVRVVRTNTVKGEFGT
jgi:hypothetical protein